MTLHRARQALLPTPKPLAAALRATRPPQEAAGEDKEVREMFSHASSASYLSVPQWVSLPERIIPMRNVTKRPNLGAKVEICSGALRLC